ncbi:TPA: DotD/TraH family lipoprotein [Burkholderia cenocepacia]|nr:DotD/TraH family lipoprotein [Burkholderia cenocepacia]
MTKRASGPARRARALSVVAAIAALSGCAVQPPAPTTEEQRRLDVLTRLDQATALAVNAQRELAMTADASVQRQATERTRLLTDKVSYDFYGDVEELLADIASKYGYAFKVFGKRPPDRVNVNVYVKKMPVLEVLRYVGNTASSWLDVAVKPGVIELTYKPSNT